MSCGFVSRLHHIFFFFGEARGGVTGVFLKQTLRAADTAAESAFIFPFPQINPSLFCLVPLPSSSIPGTKGSPHVS